MKEVAKIIASIHWASTVYNTAQQPYEVLLPAHFKDVIGLRTNGGAETIVQVFYLLTMI